ncbi:MAG: DUF4160 domain-containing protein [Candidatus Electrothrix sp. AR3]|nr:DUF4160 domain-containing protein [Candidatus Electrothrix sp. AR3]
MARLIKLNHPPQKREQHMPRIAFFFGISIYMYMDGVPHCHGVYGDYAGSFALEDGERIAGEMPPKQEKKIKAFIQANKEDLMEAWHELNN